MGLRITRERFVRYPSVRDRIEVHRSHLEEFFRARERGDDTRLTHPFPRKLYKYVNVEHAQSLQNGSIKIGTIRGYADLENGRDDAAEGTSVVYPTHISLKPGEGEEIRRGMRQMGLHSYGAVEIHGANKSIEYRAVTPNYLCYCLSLVPRSRSLLSGGNQAVFEIVNFDGFLLQLLTKLHVDKAWVGAVEYSQREFSAFDAPGSKAPDAWRKPYKRARDGYRYDKEYEYRILMMPQEGVSTAPYEPDPLLAPFFRRV